MVDLCGKLGWRRSKNGLVNKTLVNTRSCDYRSCDYSSFREGAILPSFFVYPGGAVATLLLCGLHVVTSTRARGYPKVASAFWQNSPHLVTTAPITSAPTAGGENFPLFFVYPGGSAGNPSVMWLTCGD